MGGLSRAAPLPRALRPHWDPLLPPGGGDARSVPPPRSERGFPSGASYSKACTVLYKMPF